MNLVRLKFQLTPKKTRVVWANKLSDTTYRVFAKDGSPKNEIVVAFKSDIISEVPARMNLKYAEFEVIDNER